MRSRVGKVAYCVSSHHKDTHGFISVGVVKRENAGPPLIMACKSMMPNGRDFYVIEGEITRETDYWFEWLYGNME